ncbi:Wzz/FepE/Etk N-terminal domain-containing protein [Legionella rowbothamii]|uniref:Wzz/FepE/Etk N-terminal domain-containing protein n=1 Tax=Legionella rowbothamii TaxID=96229 RepID=UPI00105499C3|nr:Wzz/FepE/Etk N-terminal domain-containing protein [Legionella rowbothamii]
MQTEGIGDNPDISMMDMLRAFYQNKVLISLCTLLGFILGCAAIYFSTPVYEAKIRLVSASEGEIAELNQGRSWDNSPLQPLTVKDVNSVFNDVLLSEEAKHYFFEHYYLPGLPESAKKGRTTTQLYTAFTHIFSVVPNPKQTNDRFLKYTVAIRGLDAKLTTTWLTQFISVVKSQSLNTLLKDMQQQNSVLVNNLRHQIDIARKTARAKRIDRITQLKEKVHTLQLASARTFWDDEAIMNDANESPFTMEMMQAEIKNLSKRTSDDAFIPNLRDLQAKLAYYQSFKIDIDKVAVFHQDGVLAIPVDPISPRKRLMLMVSLVSGMFVGVLLVMLQIAWRKNTAKVAGISAA